MKSNKIFLIVAMTAVVFISGSLAAAQQRDQIVTQQQQQPQQLTSQIHADVQKSGGSKVTRRDYPYDNSWWAIGLILVPLLILLCFPLFSTPYYGGGGHHGGHGGWGWGRSNSGGKDVEEIQQRVLKSIEG